MGKYGVAAMAIIEFKGFAGTRLEAEVVGSPDDPAVLLLHGGRETRQVWNDAASALVAAGRLVLMLDLRGHGGSDCPMDGRYDITAYVEDLRAVLSQMASRPVVVASLLSGWIAASALAEEGSNLATGLVLANPPLGPKVKAMQDAAAGGMDFRARFGDFKVDARSLDSIDISAARAELSEAAPKTHVPTLIIRGASSEITPREEADAYMKAFPNAELAEVEQGTDTLLHDQVESFNSVLLDFLEKKVPRTPPEYRTGSDARTLRDAMGCFATGVTVITTFSETGEPVGLTANSFTSVSLDPALVLVSIAKSAGTLPCFLSAKNFAVNVLHIGQQPTSNRFARRDEDRFGLTPWTEGEIRVPLLSACLANFECVREAVYEGGDHMLLIGRVARARFEPNRDPLLFFRGRYRRLHMS